MSNDGKQLEKLIATIEEVLLPRGYKIEINKRVYDGHGMQLAELDVVARGKLGSGEISWLIECRDRPSEGPAPSSWIQQLEGRRSQFRFDKVTAVSTTGFAAQAETRAKEIGIELRTLDVLDPKSLAWLQIEHMTFDETHYHLFSTTLLLDEVIPPSLRRAVTDAIEVSKADKPLLRASDRNEIVRAHDAFRGALELQPGFVTSIEPNAPARRVKLHANYTNDKSHFLVETKEGAVRVRGLIFDGEVSLKRSLVPVQTVEYRNVVTKAPISQVAAFPVKGTDANLSFELHRVNETGETCVVIRAI